MGTLEAEGYEFKANNGVLRVMQDSSEFIRGIRRASLYILEAQASMAGSESLITTASETDMAQQNGTHRATGHGGFE
jgi:hypothetical protein